MLRFRRPDAQTIERQLRALATASPSYSEVGATRSDSRVRGLSRRYRVNLTRVRLGGGAEDFARAMDALWSGAMFNIAFAEIHPTVPSFATGDVVGVLAHVGPLWSFNPCRVIYTIREERRVGFAYGTLPGHAFYGEERFVVEWTAPDEDVIFEVLSFSRPARWWARSTRLYLRSLQTRFAKLACSAMLDATSPDKPETESP